MRLIHYRNERFCPNREVVYGFGFKVCRHEAYLWLGPWVWMVK